MKKSILIIVVILLISVAIISVLIYLSPVLFITMSQAESQEVFLLSSQSPDGKYTLEAYRKEPGATIDFSIKVYLIKDKNKKLLYNAYHEYDAEIIWIDNETVSINGKALNLYAGDTYDWRAYMYT